MKIVHFIWLILSIDAKIIFSSSLSFYHWESWFCLTFYGILSLFLSFNFTWRFSLNFLISSSFLLSLSSYFLTSIWAANSKYSLDAPTVATPQPFGIYSSLLTTLTYLHLPKVARRSVCSERIFSSVITNA